MKDIAIVFDCGATNVRVIAMDTRGQILASKSAPNETDPDPHHEGGIIWDIEKMWGKLCVAAKHVTSQIDVSRIAGATVTTFGVDGAFVDQQGELMYPVVSWQCERTHPIMDNVGKYMPLEELYAITGVYPYAFNTINKMIWFRENRPDIIDSSHRFLFIPSLFIRNLTGELKNDATMMGTSMLADLGKREFSDEVLTKIGISPDLFGEINDAGEQAGLSHEKALAETGIPVGTPVFFAGHDTQFAVFGSGAKLNQPVLSSGTWEILMTRTSSFTSSKKELENNLTTEIDAKDKVYNIGQNWLGSGILEWFSRNFYADLKGDELYETMIEDASKVLPDSHGLSINPAFYKDSAGDTGGVIQGLTINTSRAEIYRALLESLAQRLKDALDVVEEAGKFKSERIICVGGGSKNRLWNQLRANACKVPIQLIDQKETTVLGASLFVFAGAGLFASVEEARANIDYKEEIFYPKS
jgi:L-fuculokinase